MSQHKSYSRILGLTDTWNDINFVSSRDRVVIDVTTRNLGTDGLRHRQSATLVLDVADARQFLQMLGDAIEAADNAPDPRQTALWSPLTDRRLNSNPRRAMVS